MPFLGTPKPKTYSAPSLLLNALEVRAIPEFFLIAPMLPALMQCERGNSSPVVVFPGFLANDGSTVPLRKFLNHLGYDVSGWQQSFNLGPKPGVIDAAKQLVSDAFHKTGKKVSLVGWSLGGIYAREVAKLVPDMVYCVITMGTPFSEQHNSTKLSKLYKLLTQRDASTDAAMFDLPTPPTAPTTSIYSKTDGVVGWQSSLQQSSDNPFTENIEIHSSHLGMGANPFAWIIIADRLAQSLNTWTPFKPKPGLSLFYPQPAKTI